MMFFVQSAKRVERGRKYLRLFLPAIEKAEGYSIIKKKILNRRERGP